MTSSEYNKVVESLQMGSELEFVYDNKRFFLERKSENAYDLYFFPEGEDGVLIKAISAVSLHKLVIKFLETPIVDNQSFNDFYSKISDYYVE